MLSALRVAGICICFYGGCVSLASASEYMVDADIKGRVEYNDNIFLTSLPHDAVSGLVVTPSLWGVIKEQNWEGELRARIESYHYSDDAINSNDQFFSLTGRYAGERNIFSLNVGHNFSSNLNSLSSDFGIAGRRVNQKNQSVTPQYTRLLTERSALILGYTYTDVVYLEAENTGFTPYISKTGSGTLVYDLTEKDKLTVSLFAVDYASKDDQITYQLFMTRWGIDHKFSETLSADFLVGISRRNTTSKRTTQFDIPGQTFVQQQVFDFSDRGLVLNAGVTKKMETSGVEARLSRDNTTNSFGGLDQTDKFTAKFDQSLSGLWRYDINVRYEDITSIGSGARTTDRNVLFFESRLFYAISRNWSADFSYRYIQRKFKSDTSDSRAPHSNRIYAGISYNFPSLSTF